MQLRHDCGNDAAPPTREGSDRWTRRPEGSSWGDFGPHDQLGRMNLIDAAKVRQAALEIREGRTFCLSLPLDFPGGNVLNPRRHPPQLRPTPRKSGVGMNFEMSRESPTWTDVVCDDYVTLFLQYSTQWDSLAHIGTHFDADGDGVAEIVYYNGFRAGTDVQGPSDNPALGEASRALALGIENMAAHGVQGRGVMVDLQAHFGDAHRKVSFDDLQQVLRADRVEVEPGDILCLHTGFAELLLARDRAPEPGMSDHLSPALDGTDRALREWIRDARVAAIVADNYSVEFIAERAPLQPAPLLPLHEWCLFRLGVPLGELWHLTPLARWLRANGRSRFMLTAPPLRLPGAVGSPVTPIATV